MRFFYFVLMVQLSLSCATRTKQTDRLVKNFGSLAEHSKISDVPFIKQSSYHCGPASLAMVMQHAGQKISLDEITSQVFTQQMKGSFKTDILSAIRRQGLLAIPVTDLQSMIAEVSGGRPIIVFQNLGLSWWPRWHYAVVTGHDFSGPDILLHTGENSFVKTDMRYFERSWILGGYWAYLVIPPGELSISASESTHVKAASILESLGKLNEAQKAYESIRVRWPKSLATLIGLGNVSFQKNDFNSSIKYLEKATLFHPDSAVAWHNLATAQGAAGKISTAKLSASKAMEQVADESRPAFQESLKLWLP